MRTSTLRDKDMDLISASSPPSLVSHPVLSAISVEELNQRFPLVKRALFPSSDSKYVVSQERPKGMDCGTRSAASWWLRCVVHHISKTSEGKSISCHITWDTHCLMRGSRDGTPTFSDCITLYHASHLHVSWLLGWGHCLLIPFTEIEVLLNFCPLMFTTSPNLSSKSGRASDLHSSVLNLMPLLWNQMKMQELFISILCTFPVRCHFLALSFYFLSLFLTGSQCKRKVHGGGWEFFTVSGIPGTSLNLWDLSFFNSAVKSEIIDAFHIM